MNEISLVVIASICFGFVFGACLVAFGLSAFRGFVVGYLGLLTLIFLINSAQGVFILAMFATIAFATFSFLPAAAGVFAGAKLIKVMKKT